MSISLNVTLTGYGAGRRRAMMWVNGRNESTSPGLHPGSDAWRPSAWPLAEANCGGSAPDALADAITSRAAGGTQWWPRVGAGLGGGNNNAALSARYAFRGDIFEVLLFRGSSTRAGLSEAGRRALTDALLEKYRLRCPRIDSAAAGAAAGDGAASDCAGGVEGSACNEVCAPGRAPLRGAFNKTCSAGAWSAEPLVCAPVAATVADGAAAPAPPGAACAPAGATLPAFYQNCTLTAWTETWAAGTATWAPVGTYAIPVDGAGGSGRCARAGAKTRWGAGSN